MPLKEEISKNRLKMKKKTKTKTMHCATIHIQRMLPICPPATITCSQRDNSNEEVIIETEVYYEGLDKSFYKTGIEMLERRWSDCITL